jgi:hypothetical protein
MELRMLVQFEAETVDKSHRANVQDRLVQLSRTLAVSLQALRDHSQKNPQHHIQHCPAALHEVAQTLKHRQHPLAHRQAPKNMARQLHRRLHHAQCDARVANTRALQ